MRHGWRGRASRHEQLGDAHKAAPSRGQWDSRRHAALLMLGKTEGQHTASKVVVLQQQRG